MYSRCLITHLSHSQNFYFCKPLQVFLDSTRAIRSTARRTGVGFRPATLVGRYLLQRERERARFCLIVFHSTHIIFASHCRQIGQFYVPLYISCTTSIVAFVFLVWKVREMAASVAGTKGNAAHKEQLVLFTRLAAQLFLLTGFFFPDSVAYFINLHDPNNLPKYMYQATTVVWKAESWCIALLWYSNPRVREGIRKTPWFKSCCGPVDADVERRSTSHSITVSSYVSRVFSVSCA